MRSQILAAVLVVLAQAGPNAGNIKLLGVDGESHNMPMLGLGVYRAQPGDDTYNAVLWALDLGYRLIDTAAMYGNEKSVGQAIIDSGIPRHEVQYFVIT
jgi:diketogulonate reductase-like aldo/keto reductase